MMTILIIVDIVSLMYVIHLIYVHINCYILASANLIIFGFQCYHSGYFKKKIIRGSFNWARNAIIMACLSPDISIMPQFFEIRSLMIVH